MKKMIVILALVMVVCAPAMATVTISGTRVGSTATVNYTFSGPNSVRAFALDLSVSTGTITAVSCSNASYWVYPGSIQISGGSIQGSGTCVCASTYPGTNPGVGTSAVTVEMGSLYTGTAPATSGTLLTLTLSNTAATVTVARNTGRGGVVMENPDEAAADNLPITFPQLECLNSSATEYTKWGSYLKPNCWCYKKNCRGDADGQLTVNKPVMLPDFNIFKAAYNKTVTQVKGTVYNGVPGICADFDRINTVNKPVMLPDFNVFKSFYNKTATTVPQCDQAPITSGPYNFWTN